MRTVPFIFTPLLMLLFIVDCNAQLSPPGLGSTQTAFWSALGVSEKLDDKNTSVTYVGVGRISDPEGTTNPFEKQSIVVINEEISHKLNNRVQYSYALSYRRQDQYESQAPYDLETMSVQQEFRIYGRLSYTAMLDDAKWKTTYRQEVRKFFTPDFDDVEDSFQLRSRLKTQVWLPLDMDHENSLLGSAEALFSISHDAAQGWGGYGYKESRFCFYYSYAPSDLPVTFDVGYMNDLVGHGHHIKDANYLALDIILENPF